MTRKDNVTTIVIKLRVVLLSSWTDFPVGTHHALHLFFVKEGVINTFRDKVHKIHVDYLLQVSFNLQSCLLESAIHTSTSSISKDKMIEARLVLDLPNQMLYSSKLGVPKKQSCE